MEGLDDTGVLVVKTLQEGVDELGCLDTRFLDFSSTILILHNLDVTQASLY